MSLKTCLGFYAGAVALGSVAFSANAAHAECLLVIEPAQDQWLIQYDPFTADGESREFDVALTNRGDTPCTGTIRVDLRGEQFGLAQSAGAERIGYSLVDERAGVDLTPRAGQSARRLNARPVNLAPGERSLERFGFAFRGDQMVSSGVYSQTVFFSIDEGNGAPVAERPVTLAVQVARTAVVGLKGQFQRNDGVATIDLGDLSEGRKELQTAIYVQSTGGYAMSVTSANRGRMRMGTSDWYLDYRLALGSQQIDLQQGDTVEVAAMTARSDDYPLSINVGSTRGKRAGRYSDTLTFVVSAI